MSATAKRPERVVLVRCPGCGELHAITARHARRSPKRCRSCMCPGAPKRGEDYRSHWLDRLSDEEIAYVACSIARVELEPEYIEAVTRARLRLPEGNY